MGRGTAPWVIRLEKNVPWLLGHYVTICFALGVLEAFSHFGLLFWGMAAQVALIVAPLEVPHIRPPVRCLLLQAAHVLVCLLFIRACWQTNLLVKLFFVVAACAHAYLVAEQAAS